MIKGPFLGTPSGQTYRHHIFIDSSEKEKPAAILCGLPMASVGYRH